MKAMLLFLTIGLMQVIFVGALILFGLKAATILTVGYTVIYTALCLFWANKQEERKCRANECGATNGHHGCCYPSGR
jgi:nicotinamide riboside transporter PnuC